MPGLTVDDVGILFRYLIPSEGDQPNDGDGDGAAGPSGVGGPAGATGPSGLDGDDKGKKKVTEQGMIVEDKKKKKKQRKNLITRDSARDQRYARYLRGLSNDIAHFDDKQGNYIHPLSIVAVASMIYSRTILFFSVTGSQVKLQSVYPPRPVAQLPIYLATDEKDTSIIYMLVPQQELHSYLQLFFYTSLAISFDKKSDLTKTKCSLKGTWGRLLPSYQRTTKARRRSCVPSFLSRESVKKKCS